MCLQLDRCDCANGGHGGPEYARDEWTADHACREVAADLVAGISLLQLQRGAMCMRFGTHDRIKHVYKLIQVNTKLEKFLDASRLTLRPRVFCRRAATPRY